MDTELLTPEEAAVYLRLNPQTTYRLLRRGQLPGVKIGRQWRISKAGLERFIDGAAGDGTAGNAGTTATAPEATTPPEPRRTPA